MTIIFLPAVIRNGGNIVGNTVTMLKNIGGILNVLNHAS
jgi:hypothetical protein